MKGVEAATCQFVRFYEGISPKTSLPKLHHLFGNRQIFGRFFGTKSQKNRLNRSLKSRLMASEPFSTTNWAILERREDEVYTKGQTLVQKLRQPFFITDEATEIKQASGKL